MTDLRIKIAEREIVPFFFLQALSNDDVRELARCSDKQLRAAYRMWPNDGAPLPTIPADDWLNDDGTARYPAGWQG